MDGWMDSEPAACTTVALSEFACLMRRDNNTKEKQFLKKISFT
jgi:hypothetical protein